MGRCIFAASHFICSTVSPTQLGIVIVQPFLVLAEPGTSFLYQSPKGGRVIHFLQMQQLVDDDVLSGFQRRQYQAPIERYRATLRTRAPTRSLIADTNAANLEIEAPSQRPCHADQLIPGQSTQMIGERPCQIHRFIGQKYPLVSAQQDRSSPVLNYFENHPFASKPYRSARNNRPIPNFLSSLLSLLLEPAFMFANEFPSFPLSASSGNGHDDFTGVIHLSNISTRIATPTEHDLLLSQRIFPYFQRRFPTHNLASELLGWTPWTQAIADRVYL